jgi:hypothetical protein
MCGLGRTTAGGALTALTAAGFISRVTPADGANAAEWMLVLPISTGSGTLRSQPTSNPRPPAAIFGQRSTLINHLEQQLIDQKHDLFTRNGIGHLAGRLYALFAEMPSLTIETAAKLLGVTVRWVTTVLSRLRHHRLIVRHPTGWARAKQDLRDQAAKQLGVLGTLLDRANRYQQEKDVWAWWQAEVTTMRTPPTRRPRRPHVTARPLFQSTQPGEREWPRYPRNPEQRGDHKAAKWLVKTGALKPGNRWQYLGETG